MTIRVFLSFIVITAAGGCDIGYAESIDTNGALSDTELRLIAVSPAATEENRVVLEGSTSLNLVLGLESRTVRITAADGKLVTVPPEMVRLADVQAVVAANGEVATVMDFDVPISVTATDSGDGRTLYEIRGALAMRRWGKVFGGIDPMTELLHPRSTTVLGDAFRAIASLVDFSVGIQLDEPRLSDEELIRRLSDEIVRLRSIAQPTEMISSKK